MDSSHFNIPPPAEVYLSLQPPHSHHNKHQHNHNAGDDQTERDSIQEGSDPTPKVEVREVGIKTKCSIEKIDDVEQEVRVTFQIALCYDDGNFTPSVDEAFSNRSLRKLESSSRSRFRPIDIDTQKVYLPRLELMECEYELKHSVVLQSQSTGKIFYIRTFKATISEMMDLRRFPFDREIVAIVLRSFGARFNLTAWNHPKEDTPARICHDEGWILYDHIVDASNSIWSLDDFTTYVMNKGRETRFMIRYHISREPYYYLYNAVLVMFIVVFVAGFTIGVNAVDLGTRLGLNFTLLLTIIAFKFVMTSFVPKVSYQTLLDFYNLISIGMLCSVILENFFVGPLFITSPTSTLPSSVDFYFAVVFYLVWIVFHILILVGTQKGWFRQSWKDVEKRALSNRKESKHADFGIAKGEMLELLWDE